MRCTVTTVLVTPLTTFFLSFFFSAFFFSAFFFLLLFVGLRRCGCLSSSEFLNSSTYYADLAWMNWEIAQSVWSLYAEEYGEVIQVRSSVLVVGCHTFPCPYTRSVVIVNWVLHTDDCCGIDLFGRRAGTRMWKSPT